GDRIVVADASNEVRVFDRAGSFVRSFGRTGEGPGEFTYLDALAFAPDGTLLARDSRLMRVTRFDTAGCGGRLVPAGATVAAPFRGCLRAMLLSRRQLTRPLA